ncbi:MAG: SIS domain-containing protein [Patescibacteria group bacterium]
MYRDYIDSYLKEVQQIVDKIDKHSIHQVIDILKGVRDQKGRLFIVGVGGSAGNASHAVNDFRKLAGIESYAPTDNVPELTARTNDEGWHTVFAQWLKGSSLNSKDAVMVLSVGGGNAEKNVSMNIVESLKLAKSVGAKVVGIVGRDGGYTKQVADACVVVPTVNSETVTPHSEAFQAVVWHLIVSHPKFRVNEGKWETVQKPTNLV